MAQWWEWSIEVEQHSLASYRPFVQAGSLVFDIGANRGRKVWIFRQLGARVVAVEPLFTFAGEFVPEFWWKFGADKMVVPVKAAISRQPQVTLQVNKFMPYVSSMDRRWMTESAHAPKHGEPYYQPAALIARKVSCTTLDNLVRQYGLPAFLKVDVEGAEDEVVGTLSRAVPALNMEFHQDWVPVGAMAHMDGLGAYQWNYCLDNRSGFIIPEWVSRGQLVEHLKRNLTATGTGSWGDIYGRLA